MNIFSAFVKRVRKTQSYHYARITSYGLCDSIYKVDYPVERADTIPVNGLDTSLIGKRWIGNRWIG